MTQKLVFPILVEIARSIVKELYKRRLHDAEVAGLQCAWDNIDYQEFEDNSQKFIGLYRACYRFPEKDKKASTLISSASRIIKAFSKYFDIKLTRNSFRRHIQELWDKNQIDISHLGLDELEVKTNEDYPQIKDVIEQSTSSSEQVNSSILIDRNSDILCVEELLEWHPILVIHGISGIGKSTFANQLSKYMEQKYTVYYSDLRYIEDFRQWGYEILSQSKVNDEINNDRLVAKLSELLESQPSFVLIDSIFQLDLEFSGFFETISLRNNQSVLFVLLSNQKLNLKISNQYLDFYPLKGLQKPNDIHIFFRSLGLKSPEYWEKMNQFYEGNFTQIIYASRFINDFFDGDVKAYWKSNSRVFSPEISQDFDTVKFSPMDMSIFSMFSEEDNVISANIMQALKKDSRTSEIWTRINYLCDLGYLNVGKKVGTNRLFYSIAPLLKSYLVQEKKI